MDLKIKHNNTFLKDLEKELADDNEKEMNNLTQVKLSFSAWKSCLIHSKLDVTELENIMLEELKSYWGPSANLLIDRDKLSVIAIIGDLKYDLTTESFIEN